MKICIVGGGSAGWMSATTLVRLLDADVSLVESPDVKIIGVGGVDSGQSAYQKIINGASLVHLYTGMIYQGPNIVSKINEELINILDKEVVQNISDIVGSKN